MKWNGSFWFLVVGLWLLVGCTSKKETQPDYLSAEEIQIIPKPKELKVDSGYFIIDENTIILAYQDVKSEAEYLKKLIESSSSFKIEIKYIEGIFPTDIQPNTIQLFGRYESMESNEAYKLSINKDVLLIAAGQKKGVGFCGTGYLGKEIPSQGLMHGIQTLRQLFVNEFHSEEKRDAWYLPILTIKDAPKFKHRGLLLDCARHFYKKEVVKKYIDLLALYKMNVLHWHLTEDQGWRIAIDKYPKLTEIGAWRTELDGSKYGGFYTKDDIREIVAYAQERHITVIPEIELPGHSQAAIAAYPHLSCTGKQVEVANDWGVFKEIYCAGNDSVFTFLEDVLTEVMELFPSKYIHIGGDETPKYRWKHCNKCQQRIKDENLTDEHGLQSYFISRIEKFLNKNGRQLIGWDEILEGGLSPNATVQSWRGLEGGIEAANTNHNAIMSPTSHCYFDYDLKAIDLEKVYSFDPIPTALVKEKQHFIIGGECNMWTEHVPDENNLDSKVFPRLLAMSEVLWSYPKERDYEEFYEKVQHHYPLLKNLGVNYGLENNPATINSKIHNGKVLVSATPGNIDLKLSYSYSSNELGPNSFGDYKGSDIILEKSGVFSVVAVKNEDKSKGKPNQVFERHLGKRYGKKISQSFEIHNAIGALIQYDHKYNQWYTAGGDSGLVDGKIGSLDFRDGNWQGFWGNDAEILLDLGEIDLMNEESKVSEIEINFYQYNNSWIFFPSKVEFFISQDGKHFENIPTMANENIGPEKRGKHIETFRTGFERSHIRYIKVKATNIGKVPDWHEAAGSDAWIFMDEIIVK